MNDLALLKVFYGRPEHFMYRQYIARNWFELLCEYSFLCSNENKVISILEFRSIFQISDYIPGDLGGLGGVFIGFSLLCIGEIGYFIVRTIYLAFKKQHRNEFNMIQAKNFRFYK